MLFCLQDTFVRAKKWVQEMQKQGDTINLQAQYVLVFVT